MIGKKEIAQDPQPKSYWVFKSLYNSVSSLYKAGSKTVTNFVSATTSITNNVINHTKLATESICKSNHDYNMWLERFSGEHMIYFGAISATAVLIQMEPTALIQCLAGIGAITGISYAANSLIEKLDLKQTGVLKKVALKQGASILTTVSGMVIHSGFMSHFLPAISSVLPGNEVAATVLATFLSVTAASAVTNYLEARNKVLLPQKSKDFLYSTALDEHKAALKMTKEQYEDYDLNLPENKEIKETIEALESVVSELEKHHEELKNIQGELEKNPNDKESLKKLSKIEGKIREHCLRSNNRKALEEVLPNMIKTIVKHVVPASYTKMAVQQGIGLAFNKQFCHKITYGVKNGYKAVKSGYETVKGFLWGTEKTPKQDIDLKITDKGEKLLDNIIISSSKGDALSK